MGTMAKQTPDSVTRESLPNAMSVPQEVGERDRSPNDLILTAEGKYALTTNYTADTVSLVSLTEGKVIAEVPVGHKPFSLAQTPDSKIVLVSNSWGNSVSLLQYEPNRLKPLATIPVGDEPRGIAVSRDGTTAYVALSGEAMIAVLDLKTRTVVARWKVGWEPWYLALTPDGTRLAVGNTRSRTVSVLDTKTGKPTHTVRVLGRNLRHLAISADGKWAYLPTISERGLGVSRDNIDRGWVVGNRLTRVPLNEDGPREAITLDTSGEAVADGDGCTISPDGKRIALTAGGTHELILMRLPDLPFIAYGGPDDHLDPALRDAPERFRRIRLGGRPTGAVFTPDGKAVVVANYLKNSLQVVDIATAMVKREIPLGSAKTLSLARRGEAIFLDADRSFGSWYSCATCHTEGHTNGGNFDTLNDGGFGKPKKTLSLRGIAQTAPYTWHGWNNDLNDAIAESLEKTMQGPKPTEDDVAAVVAYVKTLDFRPNPNRNLDGTLSASAQRGEKVFQQKACTSCHAAPTFSSPIVVKTGLETPGDKYDGFNPPALRGVYSRAPYLHDGRAGTLEAVLTEHHRPSQLGAGSDCTPEELKDLVTYLQSL